MISIVVVFPAPLGPSSPSTSPRRISNETPRSTFFSPYLIHRSRTSTTTSPPPPVPPLSNAISGSPIRAYLHFPVLLLR